MLQCVAVCCSVLQYVAVWCRSLTGGAFGDESKPEPDAVEVCVLQCVLPCVAQRVVQCAAAGCSVLQRVAVCCSALCSVLHCLCSVLCSVL